MLNLEMLDPPMLDWVEMAGTIEVFGEWIDHQWTLNGIPLESSGPIIETPPSGTLTLVAVDPRTGYRVIDRDPGCPGTSTRTTWSGCRTFCCWGIRLHGRLLESDVNGDGIVTVADMLFLLGVFGTIC